MNPTTIAAFFNRPPSGFLKPGRPHRRGPNHGWKKPVGQRQDKPAEAMAELLDEVVRMFQL